MHTHFFPKVDAAPGEDRGEGGHGETELRWKLLSCSQCQELVQRANLAPDWFFIFRQPIRSQVSSLTQLLTLTKTQKFPPQDKARGELPARPAAVKSAPAAAGRAPPPAAAEDEPPKSAGKTEAPKSRPDSKTSKSAPVRLIV